MLTLVLAWVCVIFALVIGLQQGLAAPRNSQQLWYALALIALAIAMILTTKLWPLTS